jgi:hypothetical protein
MRESFVGSIVRRLVKIVASAGDAASRGLDALVEGSAPAPQLVPVRVRANRRRF